MGTYKEIVTKTVIGKGKKTFKDTYSVLPDEKPTLVLGCWVINHTFSGKEEAEKIKLEGSFDVNIWYSYSDNTKTKVVTKSISYDDLVSVKLKANSDFNSDSEILIRSLKQPMCSNVRIENDEIKFDIDKELGVEIVGDAKVKVLVEEEDDDWDILEEEKKVTDEELKKIGEVIEEKFI